MKTQITERPRDLHAELHRIRELARQARIALRDAQRFLVDEHARTGGAMDMDRLADEKLFDSEQAFGLFWDIDHIAVRLEATGA